MKRFSLKLVASLSLSGLVCFSISIASSQDAEILPEFCNPLDETWDWYVPPPTQAAPNYLDWYLNDSGFPTSAFHEHVRRATRIWNAYASTRIQLRHVGSHSETTRAEIMGPEGEGDGQNQVLFFSGTTNQPDICEFVGSPDFFCEPYSEYSMAITLVYSVPNSHMFEFDMVFFAENYDGEIDWTPATMFGAAVHESGHALGLDHVENWQPIMDETSTASQLLTWWDVQCLREVAGYGYQSRPVGVRFSTIYGAGPSWRTGPTDIGLEEAHLAPAVAGNEDASSTMEAYLFVWTDSDDRIRTALGNGFSIDPSTETITTGEYSIHPPGATYGEGRWVRAHVDAHTRHVHASYSENGIDWVRCCGGSGDVTAEYEHQDLQGAVGLAYNAHSGRFLLAATNTAEYRHRVFLFESTDGVDWVETVPEAWELLSFSEAGWFVDLSCNENSNRCVLAYSDINEPLELEFKDLYYTSSNGHFALSSSYGSIDYQESWFGPRVAHQTYWSPSGNQQAVVSWTDAPYFPYVMTTTRQADRCRGPSGWVLCNWEHTQSHLDPLRGVGHVSVVSGEYFNEHMIFFSSDPL